MTNSPNTLKICVSETVQVSTIERVIIYVVQKVEWVVEQIRVRMAKFSVWMFGRPPTVVLTILDMKKLPA